MTLAIPKLREGTYYPSWLLDPRRRAERALVAVVAGSYVPGVPAPAGSRSVAWWRAGSSTPRFDDRRSAACRPDTGKPFC